MTEQPHDDHWIDECIAHSCQPGGPIDQTPHGRLAGMDLDAGLVLAEMRELLTGRVTAISREMYARRLGELLEQFGDLHDRRERGHDEQVTDFIERRYR